MVFELKKHRTLEDFKEENAPLIKFPLKVIPVKGPDGCYSVVATARFHAYREKMEENRILNEKRESATTRGYLRKNEDSYKLIK